MNKQEIVAKIATDTGITKTAAAAAVESLIDGITKSLKKGHTVSFVGFGTFKTANRKARAEAALTKVTEQPINPEWLMLTIAELLPKDAIVVDEALTTAASLAAFPPPAGWQQSFGC